MQLDDLGRSAGKTREKWSRASGDDRPDGVNLI